MGRGIEAACYTIDRYMRISMPPWNRSLPTQDGWPLAVWGQAPEGKPRAVVQILHGLAEHAGRYHRFGEALVAAGFAVIAHDHRGHGASVRSEEDRGHFADEDGFSKAVEDAAAVAQLARDTWPGVPLVLFGHSMGSTLAVHLLRRRSRDYVAAVLSGPTGVVGPLRTFGVLATRLERLRLGRHGRSQLLHALSFGDFNKAFRPNRTAYDWLSRDPVEVDKYASDPRCGFVVTTQHWYDHLVALGALGDTTALRTIRSDLPIHVIAGQNDPASQGTRRIGPMVAALRGAGVHEVSVQLYPDARHELLNETNREAVTADLIAWIGAHLGGGGA